MRDNPDFIPKYRKRTLYGQMRSAVREIINKLCKYKNVEIITGAICVEHVHLRAVILTKMSISSFMGYLKGKSTMKIYNRHSELQNKWNEAF